MADIGATTTRCALVDDKGQEVAPEIFDNVDFTGLAGVLRVYLDHRRASDQPTRAVRASRTSRTFRASVSAVNGFWRKGAPGSSSRAESGESSG